MTLDNMFNPQYAYNSRLFVVSVVAASLLCFLSVRLEARGLLWLTDCLVIGLIKRSKCEALKAKHYDRSMKNN